VSEGTVALFGGRRWVIDRAEILFPGNATDEPSLSVRIYHDFSDVAVWVHVDGKPSAPELRFTSDPAIYSREQLLGFVLGGSPDAAQSDASLGEKASGVAAGFLVGQIQSRLEDKLPIDTLSVDVEEGARASAVLVGKWITERIFLAYNYRIEADEDENASEGIVRVIFGRGWMLEASYGDRGNGAADILWITRF
jgi:translocation and assembly module TamB